MKQEVQIQKMLSHPNVVKMEGFFEDEDNVYILLELCSRRSLMELHKRRRAVTEPEARYFTHQVSSLILEIFGLPFDKKFFLTCLGCEFYWKSLFYHFTLNKIIFQQKGSNLLPFFSLNLQFSNYTKKSFFEKIFRF